MSKYDYRVPIKRLIDNTKREQLPILGEELVKQMSAEQRIDLFEILDMQINRLTRRQAE